MSRMKTGRRQGEAEEEEEGEEDAKEETRRRNTPGLRQHIDTAG